MDIPQQAADLREALRYHNKKYYDEDAPEISDFEYDRMLRALETLEAAYPEVDTPDSPTHHVGGSVSDKFSPVTHPWPLESLQDVFPLRNWQSFLPVPMRRNMWWSTKLTVFPCHWNMKTVFLSGELPGATV